MTCQRVTIHDTNCNMLGLKLIKSYLMVLLFVTRERAFLFQSIVKEFLSFFSLQTHSKKLYSLRSGLPKAKLALI